MNKILSASAAIAGTAAIAAPAAFIVLGGDKTWPLISYTRYIQNRYGDVGCVKDYFRKIKWTEESIKNEDPTFESAFDTSKLAGCLAVKHKEETFSESKWKGEFKLVLALSDETKGLITVINAKTKDGTLEGGASLYFLQLKNPEGNEENKQWVVKNSKEIEKQNISKIEDWIPQNGETTSGANQYWGFKTEATKICGVSDCNSGSTSKTSYSWNWRTPKKNGNETSKTENWYSKLKEWMKTHLKWNSLDTLLGDSNPSWVNLGRAE